MNQTLRSARRNQMLDCIRLPACAMVVFAHVPFPGLPGELNACLFRFAVPFFFAVSGYFSFGTPASGLLRRLKHVLKLNLAAIAICLLCDCIAAPALGGSVAGELAGAVPSLSQLARWVFLHINPFGGHLWYLTAAAVCYGIAALYTGFFGPDRPDYRMLYATGFFLFLLRFAGADMMAFGGVKLPYWLFRDGVFLGFPMFAMGMFLRQYEDRILANYRLTPAKLLGILLLGIGLSLLQWKGLSIQELPLGAVVQTAALVLLSAAVPRVWDTPAGDRVISRFRFLSTWVYIVHLPVKTLYDAFALRPLTALLGSRESWLRPIAVLTLSVIVCLPGALLSGRPGKRSRKEG